MWLLLTVFPVISFWLFRWFRCGCSGGFVSVFRVLVHAIFGSFQSSCHLGRGCAKGLGRVMLSGNLPYPRPRSRFVQYENWIHSCSPIKFTSWNENIVGRNALDLLHFNLSIYGKQAAITGQTLKDVSNKYESVFLFISWPPVNFNINRGDFLLKIRGGPWGPPPPTHWLNI